MNKSPYINKNGIKECTFYSDVGCQNNLIRKKGFDLLREEIDETLYKSVPRDDKLKILRYIKHAYNFGKIQFDDIIRDDGDRYFEHLREVALIILRIFPNPSADKIIIAFLHDIIEDTEIDFHTLEKTFGVKIALSIEAISKKHEKKYINSKFDKELLEESKILNEEGNIKKEVKIRKEIQQYLFDDQKRALNELKEAKEKRNEEYFGHMLSFDSMYNFIKQNAEKRGYKIVKRKNKKNHLTHKDLLEITWNTFDVKFADRIHNLRTQWDPSNTEKVKRKIEETKEYFLEIAKKINYEAYEIMSELIYYLEMKLMCIGEQVEEIIKEA